MKQHASVAPHDCIGSNIFAHTLRGDLIRVVPRDNEAINEVWISDRDRFSYEGIDSEDRISSPMIKQGGEWKQVSWDAALAHASEHLQNILSASDEAAANEPGEDEASDAMVDDAAEEVNSEDESVSNIAALVSPNSTLEELYLAQKLMRAMGSGNIDHRLRQCDFSDESSAPVMPWLGRSVESLETLDGAFLIGSNIRKEQPIANHRLRKAAINNEAKIHFLNTRSYESNYDVASYLAVAQQSLASELAAVAKAAYELSGNSIPANLKDAVSSVAAKENHRLIVEQLKQGGNTTVLLGNQAMMHPELSSLRILADAIANETNSKFGYLTDACNTAGAWLAGAVPHRGPAGDGEALQGKNIEQLFKEPATATILLNVEPELDAALSRVMIDSLSSNNFVVAVSSYISAALQETADVILPAATFSETSGTYVNAEGRWQSFNGVQQPYGEARPAWKILRVLGNMMKQDGFDYMSSEDVRDECRGLCESLELSNAVNSSEKITLNAVNGDLKRCADVPMYATDAIVRRASALQKTQDAQVFAVSINAAQAKRLGVEDVDSVIVKQGFLSAQLALHIDDEIPDGSVWMPMALHGNELLGHPFGDVEIEKAQS